MPGSRAAQRHFGSLAAAVLVMMACANGGDRSRSAAATGESAAASVLRLSARVVATYPHDPAAFTQGLLWHEGKLYESTGLWGQSSVRRVDLETGVIEQRLDLSQMLFGEGLARVGHSLLQLTWKNGRALRYEIGTFGSVGEHAYDGEGWGLCYDGRDLWRSDGSALLHRHAPDSFAEGGSIDVRLEGRPVARLNELECAEGWIYANVLDSDEIMRIDPGSGRVVAIIDAAGLIGGAERRRVGPLNGIAFRSDSGTFLLTGKNWPRLFEVVFAETQR